MELDDILSGAPEPAAPAPAPEPREPEAPTGEPADQETRDDRPRDEHGRFAPRTQDEQEAAPPAARQDAGPIPIQALLDERDRRQRAERELEEYRRRAAPPPAPPRVDLFEDPDGALESIRQEFRRELAAERLNYSVASAQVQYGDYGQKEAAFIEAVKAEAQNDPQGQSTLYRQMIADPNPASFAYRVGSQVLAMREIGPDPTTYKDRLVDDETLFQKMLEKRGLQPPPPQYQQPAAAPQPVFPTSLSTARASAPRQSAPAYTGSTPLSALGNPALKMS